MCTVTIVSAGGRCRLMCNRDERHGRADAAPPTIARARGHLALLPIDPQSGGTWVAATAAGLVFALLNDDGPVAPAALSRGGLIMELLDSATVTRAVERLGALYTRAWAPHRLIVSDGHTVVQLRGGRAVPTFDRWTTSRPLLFTSSALGEAAVRPARRTLFDQMITAAFDGGSPGQNVWAAQDAFHHHRWHDRPQVSVHMRRHDAATQSVTTVDVTPERVSMRYEPRDCVGVPVPLCLPRTVPAAVEAERAVLMAPARAMAS